MMPRQLEAALLVKRFKKEIRAQANRRNAAADIAAGLVSAAWGRLLRALRAASLLRSGGCGKPSLWGLRVSWGWVGFACLVRGNGRTPEPPGARVPGGFFLRRAQAATQLPRGRPAATRVMFALWRAGESALARSLAGAVVGRRAAIGDD